MFRRERPVTVSKMVCTVISLPLQLGLGKGNKSHYKYDTRLFHIFCLLICNCQRVGVWDVMRKKLVEPAQCHKWIVIDFSLCEMRDLNMFINELIQTMTEHNEYTACVRDNPQVYIIPYLLFILPFHSFLSYSILFIWYCLPTALLWATGSSRDTLINN